MREGLRLALTTLTVLPVHRTGRTDRATAGTAMVLAPAVGLLLGLVAATVLVIFREFTTASKSAPVLACVLAVTALALLTRGLHLDGLADTVDGLASAQPPEGARQVMRQPDVGPLGVVAVVLTLLVQVFALMAATVDGRGTGALLLATVTGRLAVTAACTAGTLAAAATGMGALVAGTVRRGAVTALTILIAVSAVLQGVLDNRTVDGVRASTGALVIDGLRPLLALAIGLGVARVLRRHAVRRLGGITGDVLGALLEVTTAVVLVVMALDLPPSVQHVFGWEQPR